MKGMKIGRELAHWSEKRITDNWYCSGDVKIGIVLISLKTIRGGFFVAL